MTPHLAEKLELYLAGTLPPDDEQQLVLAASADPEILAEIDAAIASHRALSSWANPADGERMAAAVQGLITSQRHSRTVPLVRSVRRRMGRRRIMRWWPAIATAAMLFIAVLSGVLWQQRSAASRDELTVISGIAMLDTGHAIAVGATVPLAAGQQIELADGAQAEVRSGADTLTLTGPFTGRSPLSEEAAWACEAGQMEAHVAHRQPGQQFCITTPHALVTVVGTRFTLRVAEQTKLDVSEGRVLFEAPGASPLTVAAGEHAQLPAMSEPRKHPQKSRVLDDHEAGMNWENTWESGRFKFGLAGKDPGNQGSFLSMTYRWEKRPSVESEFRYLVHPLELTAHDRAVRLRISVDGTDPGEFSHPIVFLHLQDTGGNHWIVLPDKPLADFPQGWKSLLLPLATEASPPELAINGDGRYEIQRVNRLIIGIGYGSGTIRLDDLEIVSE